MAMMHKGASHSQTTLRNPTPWIRGAHLDQDKQSGVRFHPADENAGIVFVRSDLPGQPEIHCRPEHLQSMPRWSALEESGNWVHHTEHVLAAIAFAAVDNVRVEMDSDRLPMAAGGTCEPFYQALRDAGLVSQRAARKVYSLKKPLCWMDGQSTTGETLNAPSVRNGRYILALPHDGFSVSSVFHWSHMPSLPIGVAEYEAGGDVVDADLLRARSYLVEPEKDQVGSALGPIQDTLMMLYPHCPPELAIEAARHKIVDFVGDFMILGRPIRGRFAAVRAGHRIHHDMVQYLIAHDMVDII